MTDKARFVSRLSTSLALKCGLAALFCVLGAPGNAQAAPSVLVTTAPVKTGSIDQTVSAYGAVEPAPGASTTLSLPLPGTVETIEVSPGATVRKGQVIAVISADPATVAAYTRAKSALRTTLGRRDQVKDLLRGRLATLQQLDQANQAVVNARSALDALKREGAGQASRPIPAPFDGVVTAVPAAQGTRLAAAAPLAMLARTTGLIASVGLDPSALANVHAGDKAIITHTTGDPGTQGKVLRLGGVANPNSGLVEASIGLPPSKHSGNYLIGEVVSAEIVTGAAHGVIVPRDAALPEGNHAVLYQVANGHARAVKVRVLASGHGKSIVDGPIDPHLPIVIAGNYQLKPGIAVRERAKQ